MKGHGHDSTPLLLPVGGLGSSVVAGHAALHLTQPMHCSVELSTHPPHSGATRSRSMSSPLSCSSRKLQAKWCPGIAWAWNIMDQAPPDRRGSSASTQSPMMALPSPHRMQTARRGIFVGIRWHRGQIDRDTIRALVSLLLRGIPGLVRCLRSSVQVAYHAQAIEGVSA